jgi:hypothetical protein
MAARASMRFCASAPPPPPLLLLLLLGDKGAPMVAAAAAANAGEGAFVELAWLNPVLRPWMKSSASASASPLLAPPLAVVLSPARR